MLERLLGFFLTLPERCMGCVIIGSGFAGMAVGGWLGGRVCGADPRCLRQWIMGGLPAGVLLVMIGLVAIGVWMSQSAGTAESYVPYFSPGEEYIAYLESPRLNSLQIRMQTNRFNQSLLDGLRPGSRVFRVSGQQRIRQLTIDAAWTGPKTLAIKGSLPPGWQVEKALRRWRDVTIEYEGGLGSG